MFYLRKLCVLINLVQINILHSNVRIAVYKIYFGILL